MDLYFKFKLSKVIIIFNIPVLFQVDFFNEFSIKQYHNFTEFRTTVEANSVDPESALFAILVASFAERPKLIHVRNFR